MKKVLCAGEINVDLVLQGYTEFPVPGREVLVQDSQLVLGSANDRRELGGDPDRPVDPAMLVPAGDQIVTPLPLGGFRQHRGRCRWQRAERIAVEIDQPVGKAETLTRESKRIGRVEPAGLVEFHSLGRVTPRCPIYLPARSA